MFRTFTDVQIFISVTRTVDWTFTGHGFRSLLTYRCPGPGSYRTVSLTGVRRDRSIESRYPVRRHREWYSRDCSEEQVVKTKVLVIVTHTIHFIGVVKEFVSIGDSPTKEGDTRLTVTLFVSPDVY